LCAASTPAPAPVLSSNLEFKPGYFFYYGSLMDAEVLQTIIELPYCPILERGYITNWKLKIWGIHPTLVPAESESKVEGVFWFISNPAHVERLATYETEAYKMTPVYIQIEKTGAHGVAEEVSTFC
jgi:Gamma-glutamyl cyclotransferase, AIG2-like